MADLDLGEGVLQRGNLVLDGLLVGLVADLVLVQLLLQVLELVGDRLLHHPVIDSTILIL